MALTRALRRLGAVSLLLCLALAIGGCALATTRSNYTARADKICHANDQARAAETATFPKDTFDHQFAWITTHAAQLRAIDVSLPSKLRAAQFPTGDRLLVRWLRSEERLTAARLDTYKAAQHHDIAGFERALNRVTAAYTATKHLARAAGFAYCGQ
jgi:hypothetical protein